MLRSHSAATPVSARRSRHAQQNTSDDPSALRKTVSFRDPKPPSASPDHDDGDDHDDDGPKEGATGDEGDGRPKYAAWMERILDSVPFTLLIVFLTIFVLFVDDTLVVASVPDPVHGGVGYVCLVAKVIAFFVFTFELVASSLAKSNYFLSFFFWLDVLTLLSFIPDIILLFTGVDLLLSLGVLAVARAGRAARAAARTPVLFRVMKVLKFSHRQTVNNSIDMLEDHASMFEASSSGRPGGLILRSMTNKVTAIVLLVYVIGSMLQTDPDWTVHTSSALRTLEVALDGGADPATAVGAFLSPYTDRIRVTRLIAGSTVYLDGAPLLRRDFIATITTPSKASSVLLNIQTDRILEALFSILSLLAVIIALAVGNLIICHNANRLVVISERLIMIMKLMTSHMQGAPGGPASEGSGPGPSGLDSLLHSSQNEIGGPGDTIGSRTETFLYTDTRTSAGGPLPSEFSKATSLGSGDVKSLANALAYWDQAASTQMSYVESMEQQLQRYLVDNMRVELEAKQARRREKELRALLRLSASRLRFAKARVARMTARLDSVEYQVKRYRRRLPKSVRRELDEEDASESGLSELSDVGSNLSVVTVRSGMRRIKSGPESEQWMVDALGGSSVPPEQDHLYVDNVDGVPVVFRGTVDGLIGQLTSLTGKTSSTFMQSFMYTFRRYTSPEHVLERLLIKYCMAPPKDMVHIPVNASMYHFDLHLQDASMNWALEVELPTRNRVLQVIYYWVTSLFDDFREHPPLMDLLRNAIETLFRQTTAPFASRLESAIEQQRAAPRVRPPPPHRPPSSLASVPTPIVPVVVGRSSTRSPDTVPSSAGAGPGKLTRRGTERARASGSLGVTFHSVSPIELARQLKLLDHATYARIMVTELFDQRWKGSDGFERSPNLLGSVDAFEMTVAWMVRLVLECEPGRSRSVVIQKLIEVGETSIEIYSFNAAMQVIGALTHVDVANDTATWEKVSSGHLAAFDLVRDTLSPRTNFAPYRQMIQRHRERVMDARDPDPGLPQTVVPYLGIHLQDLVFADDGNANYTPDSLVNFRKCEFLASVIDLALSWQDEPPVFVSVPIIQDLIIQGRRSPPEPTT